MKRFLVKYRYNSGHKISEVEEICLGKSEKELCDFMHPDHKAKVISIEESNCERKINIGPEHLPKYCKPSTGFVNYGYKINRL